MTPNHDIEKRMYAKKIAQYRYWNLDEGQREELAIEAQKARKDMPAVLIVTIILLTITALVLAPLGCCLAVQDEISVFAGALITVIGLACSFPITLCVAKLRELKKLPIQTQIINKLAKQVMSEFVYVHRLQEESWRIAREGQAKQAKERCEEEERQRHTQREQAGQIITEIKTGLESLSQSLHQTAYKFYEPTEKMIERVVAYKHIELHSEMGVIEFINDILALYDIDYKLHEYLKALIIWDCPNFNLQLNKRNYWHEEDYNRVVKAYFDELLSRVKEFPLGNTQLTACAIYYIVRSNLIKFFSTEYKRNINADTLEEHCLTLGSFASDSRNLVGYICHTISNDFFGKEGVFFEYQTLKEEIKLIVERQSIEKTHQELFDSESTTGVLDSDKTVVSPKESLAETIDAMTGLEFEYFLAKLFQKKGYQTRVTKGSGDFGIDVIADNGIVRIGIQAKCYSGNVGNDAVQQAAAGCLYYGLDRAMVITNSYFTVAAIQQAKSSKVTLWNRDMLLKECRDRNLL